jgi:hypothetical protein
VLIMVMRDHLKVATPPPYPQVPMHPRGTDSQYMAPNTVALFLHSFLALSAFVFAATHQTDTQFQSLNISYGTVCHPALTESLQCSSSHSAPTPVLYNTALVCTLLKASQPQLVPVRPLPVTATGPMGQHWI